MVGGFFLRLAVALLGLCCLISSVAVSAAEAAFRVSDIRVEGLQRLPVERVFRHLAIQKGDLADGGRLADAARSLYGSGDFEDVQLGREGDVLVVIVQERPSIAKIDITGNKSIDTEELMKGLKNAGLTVGEVFRRSTLDGITGELERQYVAQGRYGATIESETVPLPRNRIALNIKIYEGKPARIRDINVVGNQAFTDEELLKDFQLRSSHLTSFFKGDDKYSRERLGGDIERLRSFYLDRGYVDVSIESTQVAVTPDWREVYVALNITEGKRYKVKNVKLAGDLVVDEEQLKPLLVVREGQVFSQQLLTYTSDLLTRRLGNEGYTFAEVDGFTETNEEDDTVDVTFFVNPGRKVYVRRINFAGNSKTVDSVLRRELRQFERAPANSALINLSRDRLQRLGFFSVVEAETPRVPGAEDLVDVTYKVEEQPSGSIGANVGYSDSSGFIFGANVSQNNYMGTGNRVSFAISRSEVTDSYNFSYLNPYYTLDGVSRGFSLYYTATDFSKTTITSYSANRVGASVNYGYPISEYARLNFGFGVDQLDIVTGTFVAYTIQEFLNREGRSDFQSLKLNGSWQVSTLNRGVFPDRGWSQNVALEVAAPGSDYGFYKLSWTGQRYFPVSRNLTLRTRGDVAFGDGYGSDLLLPFYENYFSGGIGSVRGFRARSLGPRSPTFLSVQNNIFDPDPDPIGGNFLTEASIELLFPPPFAPDSRSLRTFLFADAGNVWQTDIDGSLGLDFAVDELRTSVGVGLSWLTAIGPLGFSFAKPIGKKPGDDTEVFQFSLGQAF
ncbi:outer membrane protein assembly factor BamA [Alcanivorax sp. 1008]|uniref:outer membrane protein assembly factor BamA n=1 Tax=Alcanivorax sp. 1008 TaxID=2816853 RepID=UPI001DD11D99|nr:outer membrane protein assembly factor BamA [Alcanivorax sp. 1008]